MCNIQTPCEDGQSKMEDQTGMIENGALSQNGPLMRLFGYAVGSTPSAFIFF
jgi:hypothetical protein